MEKNIQKILNIETSGKNLSLALASFSLERNAFNLKADCTLEVGHRHSSILKESCEFLLEKCSWNKKEITHLGVSTGPGSFTGLRVGIAFARALAQSLKIPLIGIPAFEILAKAVSLKPYPKLILIDTIGNELFAGLFKNGSPSPQEPYKIFSLPELYKKMEKMPKMIVMGEGFLRHEKEIKSHLRERVLAIQKEEHFPQAKFLAECVVEKIKKSRVSNFSWKKVVPFYLRPPLAVERLTEIMQ